MAAALREASHGPDPLQVYELRGGIYRDASWVKSPLQPMVITSTVDQAGSRILFRGYGVAPASAPIHAGLLANDALLFLDEAHNSRAFAQTLASVSKYRGDAWAERPLQAPFGFVEMTATPSRESANPFRLTAEDRENEVLRQRLLARKPTRLVESQGRVEETLVSEFLSLVKGAGEIRGGAIMVNRVATARHVSALLSAKGKPAELVIGRMRPLDRDDLMVRLDRVHSGERRDANAAPIFVVSTQCLETGADLDFDVLVSECASIDAIQQRFGRLDRLGSFGRAAGSIVISSSQVSPKRPDAIYGEALPLTWKWLKEMEPLNMGIEAPNGEPLTAAQRLQQLDAAEANRLRRIGAHAPVLLPSHLDAWVQTSPRPVPEPDVALFLHGPKEGAPDVQVVWRTDLDGTQPELWEDIVALCPPVSAEAMAVPIYEFQRWLAGAAQDPNASDLEGTGEDEAQAAPNIRTVLAWRGDRSVLLRDARDVRPGDTFVVPVSYQGWDTLGHKPIDAPDDLAERACYAGRRRVRVRLHAAVIETWKKTETLEDLTTLLKEEDPGEGDVLEILNQYRVELGDAASEWLVALKHMKASNFRLIPYPEPIKGAWVFESKSRVVEEDSGGDEPSARERTSLKDHTADVRQHVTVFSSRLADASLQSTLEWAADWHDAGKADIRFQALLRGGDILAARFARELLAKGERPRVQKARGSGNDFERSGLPDGFRHELLSLQMAEKAGPPQDLDGQLALHAIAAHHGRCRPFAPVIADSMPEAVRFNECALSQVERQTSRASSH